MTKVQHEFKMQLLVNYGRIISKKKLNDLFNEAKNLGLLLITDTQEIDIDTIYVNSIKVQELF